VDWCKFFISCHYKPVFHFDLNTRSGLRRWNSIQIDDRCEEALIINRGIYDGQSHRAWKKVTGFVRTPDGSYERFDETAFNTVFEMEKVRKALFDVGWKDVSCLYSRFEDPDN
jgi:hypothetical protein